MIILIRKRHVAYVVLLCCFVAGLSAVLWHGNAAFTAAFAPGEEGASPVVVVDAGHGGEDGGAVAADGTVESGLNLAIARRVRDLLTFAGVPGRGTPPFTTPAAPLCGRRRSPTSTTGWLW